MRLDLESVRGNAWKPNSKRIWICNMIQMLYLSLQICLEWYNGKFVYPWCDQKLNLHINSLLKIVFKKISILNLSEKACMKYYIIWHNFVSDILFSKVYFGQLNG